jgi:hypothetical protein
MTTRRPAQRADRTPAAPRLPFVWDYDLDEAAFRALLAGERTIGRLDRDWAAVRLLDYGDYADIVRMLGFRALLEGWPRWRGRVRSESRRRGLDFVVRWLAERRPDLVA